MKIYYLLFVIISLFGCSISGTFPEQRESDVPVAYPSLTIDGKSFNEAILNRDSLPDREGCKEIGQAIKMSLVGFSNDTIAGQVFDAYSNDPIANAFVEIRKDSLEPFVLQANSEGRFYFFNNFESIDIIVYYTLYRSLYVSLK